MPPLLQQIRLMKPEMLAQVGEPVEDDEARATTIEVQEGTEEGGDRRRRSTAHRVSSIF
jgi:hypothetical protein